METLSNIKKHKEEIKNIINGIDKRLLIIVGPCSIHNTDEALEYAKKLKNEELRYRKTLKIIMRTYFEKPRTTVGWEGFAYDPHLDGTYDIKHGINESKKLLNELNVLDLGSAAEVLNMDMADNFIELLSYAAIGARNSEDQNLRKYASGLDCPVGIKHPRSGNLSDGLNGVISITHKHKIFRKEHITNTEGNSSGHMILRGHHKGSNLTYKDIKEVYDKLSLNNKLHKTIIADLSHDSCILNGVKDYKLQSNNLINCLKLMKESKEINSIIKGFMIESNLNEGNQKIKNKKELKHGISITDPCINFEKTKELLEILNKYVLKNNY